MLLVTNVGVIFIIFLCVSVCVLVGRPAFDGLTPLWYIARRVCLYTCF